MGDFFIGTLTCLSHVLTVFSVWTYCKACFGLARLKTVHPSENKSHFSAVDSPICMLPGVKIVNFDAEYYGNY